MSEVTLADFLLARIAEDEAAAKDCVAFPEAMRAYDRKHQESYRRGWKAERASDLISRWHPARVLAECEAKRRIVEVLVEAEAAVAGYDNDDPNNPPSYWQEWGNLHALRFAAESHAAVYADHPDYRQEWKP